MKIIGLGHALPSNRCDNDDVLALYQNALLESTQSQSWTDVKRELQAMLDASGAKHRYLSSADENAFSLGMEAANSALEDSGIDVDSIDVVIYASVSRGWLEPSMAASFQAALKCTKASAFDVIDACASWLRAVQIAKALLDNGSARRCMIVSVESAMHGFVNFNLGQEDMRSRYLAASTLGEAAAVTILEADNTSDFYVKMRTFAQDHELCVLPLQNASQFMPKNSDAIPLSSHFSAHSLQLVRRTCSLIASEFKQDPKLSAETPYDIAYSHAVSQRAADMVGRLIGWPAERYYSTFQDYGNTAAATIPLALSLSYRDGSLSAGKRCLVLIGSAGITVGFASFEF